MPTWTGVEECQGEVKFRTCGDFMKIQVPRIHSISVSSSGLQ